jgi:hypothetical protein
MSRVEDDLFEQLCDDPIKLNTQETFKIGFYFSLSLVTFLFILLYFLYNVFGSGFDEITIGLNSDFLILFILILAIFAIGIAFFYDGIKNIPVGKCGVVFFYGKPIENKVLTTGDHWILRAPFIKLELFDNDKQVNTTDMTFNNIVTFNKAFMKIVVTLQWKLLNPFKFLHQTTKGIEGEIFSSINNIIANYINSDEITNSNIFVNKQNIEDRIFNDLGFDLAGKFGRKIHNVSIQISHVDEQWNEMNRKQSEIEYWANQIIALSKSLLVSIKEAAEIIAIKEKWINAYKVDVLNFLRDNNLLG